MSSSIGALVDFQRCKPITDPPVALSKDTFALPDLPTAFELDEINSHQLLNGTSIPATPTGAYTPSTPSELEESGPLSPDQDEATEALQTLSSPPINKYRVLAACLMNFGNGLNDSAPGALIPYMEKDYHIGYAIVSLIFVANAIGFLSAAPLTHALQSRIGRGKTYAISLSIFSTGFIMLVCHPPFPVVVLSFFFLGLGMAINLALSNVFCANLAKGTTILGFMHGSYGIGGTIGPLMATGLVTHGRSWSTFYYIMLAVGLMNLAIAFFSFRTYEIDSPVSHSLQPTQSNPTGTTSKSALLWQAVHNRTTILGALFIFAYQGAEVSISGWVISFLISYRHSSPSRVGYVTSGFWGGITLGRFLLSPWAHKIGEKASTFFLIGGAAAFQLLVWLVPNVIGEAVAVSIVGLLLGPVYPCATAVFSRLIPRRLQMSSLAFVSALGSSGGAVAPFFTGLLAQSSGTWVLHPICIGLFLTMLFMWLALPRQSKRRD
ncbi:uncharacterized protein KY384_007737 [Bacidia gigantensis]|uniref:uncharacterized protein n=1 Tax=Bacidia gigantensis TaxID=2732470 RepID=UPI001D03B444|nr:uncharacterized protein KY384_007737 [Bacidia gigantensis]KAG8527584.1 hypothetical protein KY384_007737 [Bacidia gigantensis]